MSRSGSNASARVVFAPGKLELNDLVRNVCVETARDPDEAFLLVMSFAKLTREVCLLQIE